MDNFISPEFAYSKALASLKHYESQGKIDVDDFDTWTLELLYEFGLHTMLLKGVVIEVRNGVATLPIDYIVRDGALYMESVWLCHRESEPSIINRTVLSKEWTYYLETKTENLKPSNDVMFNCESDDVKVTRRIYFNDVFFKDSFFKDGLVKYKNRLEQKNKSFSKQRFHRFSNYSYDIKQNELITDCENGDFYIEYYIKPRDKEQILIPNNELFEKMLAEYVLYNQLKQLYYNFEDDLKERMMLAERDFELSKGKFKFDARLPQFKQLVEMKQKERRWFSFNHTFLYDVNSNPAKYV